MSLVTGQLCLNGTPVGSVDVGAAGQAVSECVVAAKASCMALLNAQLAAHQGGDTAAATAVDDEATVYEDNLVDDGAAEAADARLLSLGRSPPAKKHKPAAQQGRQE